MESKICLLFSIKWQSSLLWIMKPILFLGLLQPALTAAARRRRAALQRKRPSEERVPLPRPRFGCWCFFFPVWRNKRSHWVICLWPPKPSEQHIWTRKQCCKHLESPFFFPAEAQHVVFFILILYWELLRLTSRQQSRAGRRSRRTDTFFFTRTSSSVAKVFRMVLRHELRGVAGVCDCDLVRGLGASSCWQM